MTNRTMARLARIIVVIIAIDIPSKNKEFRIKRKKHVFND